MDPEPLLSLSILLDIVQPFTTAMAVQSVVLVVLLCCSALISGAEVAFFSLTPSDVNLIRSDSGKYGALDDLINRPKRLLATILIGNNFVNIGIIILSSYLTASWFDFSSHEVLGFWIQVVVITFLILLVGEVIPKVYANQNSMAFAMMMAPALLFLRRIFLPLSLLLINSTGFIERKLQGKGNNLSVDDLEQALNITENAGGDEHEEKILRGIVKFGNTEVRQIMKPRMDVIALESTAKFEEVLACILDSGFSRIPVYKENFDQVIGMLYIKDLLPYIERGGDLNWVELLRPAFFVPENKKIDDLLLEFQSKKIHQAIVVDEYGGTNGIVTLEDVIEEIVGDISDEFDDEDLIYSKLDDRNYVFEGKTPLNDFYRVIEIDGQNFEDNRGDADTLAGFVLELTGAFPNKNAIVEFEGYELKVEQVLNRRISRIKVTLPEPESLDDV